MSWKLCEVLPGLQESDLEPRTDIDDPSYRHFTNRTRDIPVFNTSIINWPDWVFVIMVKILKLQESKCRNSPRAVKFDETPEMFKKQQLLKAVVYRIYSSLITFCISFLLTSNLVVSLSISLLDSLFKIFSYYIFDELWARLTGFRVSPAVVFLTGLSGSGKTTIAGELIHRLKRKGVTPILLDGDEIRNAIRLTGFDEDSRKKHNLNVGYMASLLEKQGKIVIVSLISPYDDIRQQIRRMCGRFIEVYVATDLKTCMERDTKGLYAKAIQGEITDFTGISAPYFPPQNPELVLDTTVISPEESSIRIINFLRK